MGVGGLTWRMDSTRVPDDHSHFLAVPSSLAQPILASDEEEVSLRGHPGFDVLRYLGSKGLYLHT
jgi:hypothetical protein